MKYRKISLYGLIAGGLIVLASLLRIVLIGQGWPLANSDESTMGIMALHIAAYGDHPTFFYGQRYMGTLEAFLGAGLFKLFGHSLFMLRMGKVGMFALFLVLIYFLTRKLFSRGWALVTVFLLGAGSAYTMAQELWVYGGYVETLIFSTILFLSATWLAHTYTRNLTGQQRARRLLVYLLWGLTAGLGFWSDLLIIPSVLMSGLLLLLVCPREVFRPMTLLCIITGLLIGAAPLINYNLHAAPGDDSLSVLRKLQGGNHQTFTPPFIWQELHNTFFSGLPMMTGEPFCPVTEYPFLNLNSPDNAACASAHGSWSAAYLFIGAISFLLTTWEIWRNWRRRAQLAEGSEAQRASRIALARWLLLLSTCMSLFLYTFSSAPLLLPGLHARYLVCLLIGTPVVLWPLWLGVQKGLNMRQVFTPIVKVACTTALICLCLLALVGSTLTFSLLPATAAANQRDAILIQTLNRLHIRDMITEYWTCDKIAFETDEHIICVSVGSELQLSHNRYTPYIHTVAKDPHPAYVFPLDQQLFMRPIPSLQYIVNPNVPIPPNSIVKGYDRIVIVGYSILYWPGPAPSTSQKKHEPAQKQV